MLLCIDNVLPASALKQVRMLAGSAQWEDGAATAGEQAQSVKCNEQIPLHSVVAERAGRIVLDALYSNPVFLSATLPVRILPPMFNRYRVGQTYGAHIDNSIRTGPEGRIRADVSSTIFLSDPEDYDGGELTIETSFGAQSVKLPAGSMVLYPASSLHRVTPVTKGERLGCFFWTQSMIRNNEDRANLFDMDRTIQLLQVERGTTDPACITLSGLYHNFVRRWAET
ncbi:MAG: Fe2+-dependent dioxygenase [Beijerinckiaceae bacterium]